MADVDKKEISPCDKKKVLIADDEEQIRNMFKLFVETGFEGVEVDTAIHGEEAVESFMEKHHAVILMDLHMPVMDGTEAFREIEDHCQVDDWEIPAVIFCTAYDPPCDTNRVLKQYDHSSILKKPITEKMLSDAIRKVLA